jgi:HSP20 family protein
MTTPTNSTTPSPRASEEQAPRTTTKTERAVAVPRLIDWLQSELLAFPRPGASVHEREMRCEQYVEDERFVLRIELPGIDPDKDVDISVADGVLTVHAERHESRKEGGHSEFFYGKLVRTFLLPHGAHEDEIAASYRDGVLEVTVPLPAHPQQSGRRVPVARPSD